MPIRPDLARQNIPTGVAANLCYRTLSDPTAWHVCLVGASRTAIVATTIRACLAEVVLLPRPGHTRAREMKSNRMPRMGDSKHGNARFGDPMPGGDRAGCRELPSRLRAVTMKLHDLIGVPKQAKQTAGGGARIRLEDMGK
jgi:hypothetical protein